jgi:ParB-like chromosome segregation protein Spo0J
MSKRIIWKIEKRKLKDLKPHPNNPRQFTEKGMKDLENSINSIGFMQPININQDGTILSGHARTLKLKEMGEIEVDVYVPDRILTPKQEEEVLIRANANTAGQWDWDLLANEFDLEEINEWGLEVPNMELDQEEKDDKDLSDSLASKYILEIECDSEAEQEILYNRFLGEKLKVKILSI